MGAMIGRFVGFFTLQKIKTERGLLFVSIMAVYLVFVCMFTSGVVARTSIVMVGLCNSIMWPCIFPLSISGLGKYTSQGAGLLCTMVVGGAIIPMIQAFLAEETGLGYNFSFIIVLLCYLYILYFALVGHKVAAKEAEIFGHTT
jgi:FHS family L-fucose permease-like MFS transporter